MKVIKKNEAGIVSIMVTMVMLIVISLIVLGLAEISRTEQRNTTDNQLSVQAFYGAESGVNDAIAAIAANGQPVQSKLTCADNAYYSFNGTINSTDNVGYTCLTINPTPSTLSNVVKTSSTVIPITAASPITSLTLDWQLANNTSYTPCNTTVGSFPADTSSNWTCDFPVLRVDLLNANLSGGLLERTGPSPNGWSSNTATMFFLPTTSGPSQPADLSSRGSVFAAHCTTTDCTDNIKLGLAGTNYYMRVTTIYKTDSQLTISALPSTNFVDTQVVIDSTGQAQDVLRRIQVAVDLTDANSYIVPSSALITEDSVCKQFGVAPGYFSITNTDLNNTGSGGDTLCQVQHYP